MSKSIKNDNFSTFDTIFKHKVLLVFHIIEKKMLEIDPSRTESNDIESIYDKKLSSLTIFVTRTGNLY